MKIEQQIELRLQGYEIYHAASVLESKQRIFKSAYLKEMRNSPDYIKNIKEQNQQNYFLTSGWEKDKLE